MKVEQSSNQIDENVVPEPGDEVDICVGQPAKASSFLIFTGFKLLPRSVGC